MRSPPVVSCDSFSFVHVSATQFSVSLMMVINVISGTSINIALVTMARDLGTPQASIEWPIVRLLYIAALIVSHRS